MIISSLAKLGWWPRLTRSEGSWAAPMLWPPTPPSRIGRYRTKCESATRHLPSFAREERHRCASLPNAAHLRRRPRRRNIPTVVSSPSVTRASPPICSSARESRRRWDADQHRHRRDDRGKQHGAAHPEQHDGLAVGDHGDGALQTALDQALECQRRRAAAPRDAPNRPTADTPASTPGTTARTPRRWRAAPARANGAAAA